MDDVQSGGFERSTVRTLVDRLAEAPKRLVFVTGPRQAGKTTMTQQALARCPTPSLYVALDVVNVTETRKLGTLDDRFRASSYLFETAPSRRDELWLAQSLGACEEPARGTGLRLGVGRGSPNCGLVNGREGVVGYGPL